MAEGVAGLRETHFASALPTLPADQPETRENQPSPSPRRVKRGEEGFTPRPRERLAPWFNALSVKDRGGREETAAAGILIRRRPYLIPQPTTCAERGTQVKRVDVVEETAKVEAA